MPWYAYLVHFIGGIVFVNGIPHFVHGVAGEPFPSPFAHPPGHGESTPVVNVLWGSANLAGGFALIVGVHHLHPGLTWDMLAFALGGFLCAIALGATHSSRSDRDAG